MRRLRDILRVRRREPSPASAQSRSRDVDLRIDTALFAEVRAHVEDFSQGEEAGFLLCSVSQLAGCDVLLAREWLPVPETAVERNSNGSVLTWSAAFNSQALNRALDRDATLVLVHSHGHRAPAFSGDDRIKERGLFGTFSRLLDPLPTGTFLLGDGDAVGSFWASGSRSTTLGRLVIVGDALGVWSAADRPPALARRRRRLARQSVAIGPDSDAKLDAAKVAVVGISGGGSHIVQQLAHIGVGTLIVLDDERIDETNLGRVVGAVATDVDVTTKIDMAERLVKRIDPDIDVVKVLHRFPSPEAISALKEADVIVACVDRFDARENLNAFARRHLMPLVDVGLAIGSSGERLRTADGQVAVALPGQPCLRCWLITDAALDHERRYRPPGYDQNPDAPGDPQVVSMNGTLASEACNCVLDLVTGYSGGRRGAKFWQYEGRTGTLTPHDVPEADPSCPACSQEGRGDPSSH